MRYSKALASLGACAILGSALVSAVAHAADPWAVSSDKGSVTVTASAPWHVNKAYPWKLTINGTKLDKAQFTLTDDAATITGAPAGEGVLRGGVCSANQCMSIEAKVTIK